MNNQPEPSKIRVVVADDHPIVRAGITTQLAGASDIEVVRQVANGDDALAAALALKPNVMVLDINMPGLAPMEVLHALRQLPTMPQVLILTAHDDIEYVLAMLKAGAKGYLLKDEEPEAITEAVRSVAQGKTWLSATVMANLVHHSTRDLVKEDEPDLSAREIEVLRLLAGGRDNQEIAMILGITERTVRYHLRNIYDKLGVRRRGAAIAWAVRQRLSEE